MFADVDSNESNDIVATIGFAAVKIIAEILKLIKDAIKMAMIKHGIIKEPLHKKMLRHAVDVLNWVKKTILSKRGIRGAITSIVAIKLLQNDFKKFEEEHGGDTAFQYILNAINLSLNKLREVFQRKSPQSKYVTGLGFGAGNHGNFGRDSSPIRRERNDDLKETLKGMKTIIEFLLKAVGRKIAEIIEGLKHTVNEKTGVYVFKEKTFIQKKLEQIKYKISDVLYALKHIVITSPTFVPLMIIAPLKGVLWIAKRISNIADVKVFRYWVIQNFGVDYVAYLKSHANKMFSFVKGKMLNLLVKVKSRNLSAGYDPEHGEYIDV